MSPQTVLLLSPLLLLAYLPFLNSLNHSYISIVYNTIFLGSFHVLLTPLFSNWIPASTRGLRWPSVAIGVLGAALALCAGLSELGVAAKLAGIAVVISVVFHSLQQQLGLLALFEKLENWRLVKFLFYALVFLVSVNTVCVFLDVRTEIAQPLFAGLALLCVLGILWSAGRSRFTFLFLLRMFSWPVGIYLVALQPWTFAIHGIEYAALYFWTRPSVKTNKPVEFWIVALLTVLTYLGGSLLILTGQLGRAGEWILALHFGIQFRHYWLDRQIFKISKPAGREMYRLLKGPAL